MINGIVRSPVILHSNLAYGVGFIIQSLCKLLREFHHYLSTLLFQFFELVRQC